MRAYRTAAVAHADVALDVERGRAGEPEGLHVRVDDGLVDAAVHAPRALGCNSIDILGTSPNLSLTMFGALRHV